MDLKGSSSARSGRISENQRQMLFQHIKENPQLIKSKFSATFTYKNAQQLWKNIETELNAITGTKKDWKQWRKTWQDFHSKTKIKSCKIKKHRMATGGGPQIKEELTNTEEELLNIISSVEVNGDDNVSESATEFHHDFNDLKNVEIIYADLTEQQTCSTNLVVDQDGVTEVIREAFQRIASALEALSKK
ncbi:hypothetical protein FQR65_LT19600 [Abscondita terminalis]|nr:hypothetical protein FQR65_LT19600 [Abscondita terminalis]